MNSDDPLDELEPALDAEASGSATVPDGDQIADADAEDQGREWWDDPALPWRHKPGRSDIACMTWIGIFGIFNLLMLPLRGWLLGHSVPVLVALTGSRSGTAGLGSLVRVGDYAAWWWPVLAGTLMSLKFDWIYWWAGKLWGRGLIEVWAGQSERAARNYATAERWAVKLGVVGMFVAYVPIPLPIMAVVFVLAGATGMSIKKFVALDFASCLAWLLCYFLLGYLAGEPAVYLLKEYAKIANYVAIALVVGVLGAYYLRASRKSREEKAAKVARRTAAVQEGTVETH